MIADLPDTLDVLIKTLYVERRRGVGYLSLRPRPSEAMESIEEAMGPDIGSSDHFLLFRFDRVRRELMDRPVSPWSDPGSVSGEIPNAK